MDVLWLWDDNGMEFVIGWDGMSEGFHLGCNALMWGGEGCRQVSAKYYCSEKQHWTIDEK